MLSARSENRLTFAVFAVAAYSVAVAFTSAVWAIAVPQTCFFLLGIAWLVRPVLSPPSLVALIMAAIGVVQIALQTTTSSFLTATAVCGWMACAVVAFLARECARDKILQAFSYFAGVIGCLAILVRFTSTFHVFWLFKVKYKDVFGPYVYRNHFAAFVELALGPALYLAMKKKEQRALFIMIAAVLLAGVVLAESRAGLILTSFEVILIVALGAQRRIVSKSLVVVLAFSALAGAAVVGWSGIAARFQERNAYHVRKEIVKSSIDMIRDRPLAGWGLGTWRSMYPSYARIDPGVIVNEAHNDWAQWACDAGVAGVLAMLAFAGWCIARGVRTIWGIGVPIVFVHALVDYPLQEPSIMILVMVLAGLSSADRKRHGSARNHSTAGIS